MKSETPIRSKVPTAYGLGAQQAMTEPLEDAGFRSTADINLRNQKVEAHAQALADEEKHYAQNHPDYKPEVELFETPEPPHDNHSDVEAAMRRNLVARRRRK